MFNILRRLFAEEAIRFENGRAAALKGIVPGWVLSDIADILRKHGVDKGEIWISSAGRISFSKAVPATAHQRLRNIVASR